MLGSFVDLLLIQSRRVLFPGQKHLWQTSPMQLCFIHRFPVDQIFDVAQAFPAVCSRDDNGQIEQGEDGIFGSVRASVQWGSVVYKDKR